MFDIGWGELVVIGIVALIAIGPKELPTVLRTLGQYMGKVRRMAAESRRYSKRLIGFSQRQQLRPKVASMRRL